MKLSSRQLSFSAPALIALSGSLLLAGCIASPDETIDDRQSTGGMDGSGASEGTGATAGTDSGTGGTGGDSGGGDTGGSASGGGTNDPSDPCSGADIFCEDFEDLAVGAIPTGDGWYARGQECSTTTYGASALPVPRAGSTQALKSTDHIYASCRLATHFEAPDDYWMRAYVYWDESISFDNKELMALELLPESAVSPQPKDDPAVRFGSRTKEPCVETPGAQVTIIGFGEEQTGCDGTQPIPQGRWFCFEAHIQQSAGQLSVESYLDSTKLNYQAKGKADRSIIETGNASPLNHLRMGLFATAGGVMGDVYVDDVAIGTHQLGCAK